MRTVIDSDFFKIYALGDDCLLYDESCLGSKFSTGFDVKSTSRDDVTLRPFECRLVPTGLYVTKKEFNYQLPNSLCPDIQLRSRSGLALKHQTIVLNAPATIDIDYEDAIGVVLYNANPKESYTIKYGDRVAQMVFARCILPATILEGGTSKLKTRGSGGFGSTGK